MRSHTTPTTPRDRGSLAEAAPAVQTARPDATAAATGEGRPRRTAPRVLVVLGSVLAVLAILAVWVSRQALETDEWTRTSSALLEQPAVQTAVAGYLVEELYANVDVAGELRKALPDRADALAAPAANALRGAADDVAKRALDRPRVQMAWEEANRRAHALLVAAVLNNGRGAVSTQRGVVTLDLRALLTELAGRVGAGTQLADKLPPGAAQIQVLRPQQLGLAQSIARAIKPLTLLLLFGVFASFGAAVALARGRRREILRDVGLGLIFAGATTLVIRQLAGTALVDRLAATAAIRPAIQDTWRIGTSLLLDTAVAVTAYGALFVAGAWLAGPAHIATRLRFELAPYLRDTRLTYGVLAAVVLLVLVWGPTEATRRVVPAIVLIAIAVAGVRAVRRQVAAEFPNAQRQPGARRTRAPLELASAIAAGRARAPASAASSDGAVTQLERLDELHRTGGLDDDEFRAAKQRVLTGAT